MKKLLSVWLVLSLGLSVVWAEEKKDPIDAAMEAAMTRNSSAAGMVQAIDEALARWDKKLNTTYKALKVEMKADEWQELVVAQKAWIAFRDAQIKSMDTTFANMEGTMWIPINAEMQMNLTKQRAQFLENMLHNLSMK